MAVQILTVLETGFIVWPDSKMMTVRLPRFLSSIRKLFKP
jgi:hypothetical protein